MGSVPPILIILMTLKTRVEEGHFPFIQAKNPKFYSISLPSYRISFTKGLASVKSSGPNITRVNPLIYLCEHQAAFRLRDRAPYFTSGLYPLLNNNLRISQGFLICCSICRTSGQLRNFCNICLIFITPIHDNLVLNHLFSLPFYT